MIVEHDALSAAFELLRQVPAADTAPVHGPGKHLLQGVDRAGEKVHELVVRGIAEKRLRELFADIDHHGIFLQELQELQGARFSLTDPRQRKKVFIGPVVFLQIEERPELRQVIKVFKDGIISVFLLDRRLDDAAGLRDPGEHGDQEPLLKILVKERGVGEIPASAMDALDDVELPAKQKLFHLRGPGNVDPGNDLCLEFFVADPAMKGFLAVRLRLVNVDV